MSCIESSTSTVTSRIAAIACASLRRRRCSNRSSSMRTEMPASRRCSAVASGNQPGTTAASRPARRAARSASSRSIARRSRRARVELGDAEVGVAPDLVGARLRGGASDLEVADGDQSPSVDLDVHERVAGEEAAGHELVGLRDAFSVQEDAFGHPARVAASDTLRLMSFAGYEHALALLESHRGRLPRAASRGLSGRRRAHPSRARRGRDVADARAASRVDGAEPRRHVVRVRAERSRALSRLPRAQRSGARLGRARATAGSSRSCVSRSATTTPWPRPSAASTSVRAGSSCTRARRRSRSPILASRRSSRSRPSGASRC